MPIIGKLGLKRAAKAIKAKEQLKPSINLFL